MTAGSSWIVLLLLLAAPLAVQMVKREEFKTCEQSAFCKQHRPVKDIQGQNTKLTGTTPLPPLFSIGYHQCRWNYNDEQDVAAVNKGFDDHDMPMDVIWLDIEHTDGKKYFTWDKHKFPTPADMVAKVAEKGADVGGFFGNPDEQLLSRWYQTGAFQPFFRAHAHIDTRRREPWLFSEQTQGIIREALRTRYALLPYWYTLFQQHSENGVPPMRPLFYEFESDDSLLEEQKQWMVGSGIMARPVMEKDTFNVQVKLPRGEKKTERWYEWVSGSEVHGESIYVDAPITFTPVYQRGGIIIPTWQRIRRSATLMKDDPLTLFVALDSNGASKGEIYLDDGTTHDYQSGQFVKASFNYKTESSTEAVLEGEHVDGKFAAKIWVERVVVRGVESSPKKVEITHFSNLHQCDSKMLIIRTPDVFRTILIFVLLMKCVFVSNGNVKDEKREQNQLTIDTRKNYAPGHVFVSRNLARTQKFGENSEHVKILRRCFVKIKNPILTFLRAIHNESILTKLNVLSASCFNLFGSIIEKNDPVHASLWFFISCTLYVFAGVSTVCDWRRKSQPPPHPDDFTWPISYRICYEAKNTGLLSSLVWLPMLPSLLSTALNPLIHLSSTIEEFLLYFSITMRVLSVFLYSISFLLILELSTDFIAF